MITHVISVLIFTLSFSPSMFGQAETATLLGTITDSNGATVPGTKVTAAESATGFTHQSVTNESSNFTFPDMPPGKYSVNVEATGFKWTTYGTQPVTEKTYDGSNSEE